MILLLITTLSAFTLIFSGYFVKDLIKNKNNFEVVLLTANKNYKKLVKQAFEFNVKNILIYDNKFFNILKKKIKSKTIKVFSKKTKIRDILKKKN